MVVWGMTVWVSLKRKRPSATLDLGGGGRFLGRSQTFPKSGWNREEARTLVRGRSRTH